MSLNKFRKKDRQLVLWPSDRPAIREATDHPLRSTRSCWTLQACHDRFSICRILRFCQRPIPAPISCRYSRERGDFPGSAANLAPASYERAPAGPSASAHPSC